MTEFWNVLREVDPQNAIREADQPVRVIICGPVGSGKRALARTLGGNGPAGNPLSRVVLDVLDVPDDVPIAVPSADLYLYVAREGDDLGPLQRSHLRQLSHQSGRVLRILTRRDGWLSSERLGAPVGSDPAFLPIPTVVTRLGDDEAIRRDVMPTLLRQMPHLALPLGRHLTSTRQAAAEYLIADTARVNAEFAVMSSLPALVPVVGTFASVGTDLVVLTKNQVMLLLKLALVYQRPIDNRVQMFAEVVPVIGAAFFWRSAARSLIALLPGPLAIAPRGAVAYVGTYVMGKAGQYYYQWGRRPSSDVLDSFREDALRQLGGFTPLLERVGRRFKFP